jgi:hypothetical protein
MYRVDTVDDPWAGRLVPAGSLLVTLDRGEFPQIGYKMLISAIADRISAERMLRSPGDG